MVTCRGMKKRHAEGSTTWFNFGAYKCVDSSDVAKFGLALVQIIVGSQEQEAILHFFFFFFKVKTIIKTINRLYL